MARRPLLAIDAQVPVSSRQSSGHSYNAAQGYGAILPEGSSNLRASPERYRRDSLLDRVPEETAVEQEDEELEAQEWDLAEQGFYSGESFSFVRTGGVNARKIRAGSLVNVFRPWYKAVMSSKYTCRHPGHVPLRYNPRLHVLVQYSPEFMQARTRGQLRCTDSFR